jgi:hypothetical protein
MTGGASATDVSNLYGNLYNPTNTPQTATYIVTPKSFFGYEGEQFTLTVIVNPIATINEMSAITCDGVEFIVVPVESVNGIVAAFDASNLPSTYKYKLVPSATAIAKCHLLSEKSVVPVRLLFAPPPVP